MAENCNNQDLVTGLLIVGEGRKLVEKIVSGDSKIIGSLSRLSLDLFTGMRKFGGEKKEVEE